MELERKDMAGRTGLEPLLTLQRFRVAIVTLRFASVRFTHCKTTSYVTGRRSNQLNYHPAYSLGVS